MSTTNEDYVAQVIQDVSHSNFQFSNALQEHLPTDGNLVFSPLSLGLVLLMARFGARGQTAIQIETALKLPYDINGKDDLVPIRLGYFKILQKIQEPAKDYNVTVATRMYTANGFQIDKEFKKISKQTLDVPVFKVNFTEPATAAESINSWVQKKTNGKITQLVSPGDLNGNTKLMLLNVVYFKSPWKYPFDAESTGKASFNTSKNVVTNVDMMVSEELGFPFGDVPELNARVVSLPYKGDRFSMHVMIPNEGHNLEEILVGLKTTSMKAIRKNIRTPGLCEKVKIHLPKFKIESDLDLVGPLQKMGAVDMFKEEDADFSGIPKNETNAPKLFVSVVTQKAYIAVDEEGTEAAAATEIIPGVSCMPTLTVIKANRPFYYQIVEDGTNAVIFAGVVRDPSASGEVTAFESSEYD